MKSNVVGLIGYSLNRRLREYIDDQPADDGTISRPSLNPELPEAWLLEARWTDAELKAALGAYQAGETSRELAQRLGVSKTAVVRLLRRHDILVRGRGRRPRTT